MTAFLVTGTDTDIGKTVVASMLTLALNGIYWKPIQCGTAEPTDTQTVAALSLETRPSVYEFEAALSPHRAAELESRNVDWAKLELPRDIPGGRPLIIEGAGGLMVPLTRNLLQIELFARWRSPIILVARTALGTINHTLLSLEALRLWRIPVHGIIFVGDEIADSERTISEMGAVKRLGRLPRLPALNAHALRAAFQSQFNPGDFVVG